MREGTRKLQKRYANAAEVKLAHHGMPSWTARMLSCLVFVISVSSNHLVAGGFVPKT